MPFRLILAASAAALAGVAACAQENGDEAAGSPESADAASTPAGDSVAAATARLITTDGSEVGTAAFTQGPEGVVIRIEAEGLPEDARGAWHGGHLHETGDCSASDFTSAGSHINPSGRAHGLLNPDGPDNADLGNFWIHADGALMTEFYTTRVSIDGRTDAPALLDADGSAFILHANPDDHSSQPIGGAGPRILCGVIEAG
ncbi:superoxide dismutase [Marinicauda salina]|uniref:Superoxide dismutase n=1 Tax=Marinicauda salina TaxID=2135793 RepID=A0A2U2BRI3_9PROT|nr:superoxide dismutase family protein [Marinicauda salina]PWE16627.1 superoxide dismutase [Marinicauda salina]